MLSRPLRQWSIASLLQWGILTLVTLQSCLLLGAFLLGGVLTNSRDYATQVFTEKMANRLLTLQSEMTNRWSRLDGTAAALASLTFADAPENASQEELRHFWQQACVQLLQLMRSAGVTDSFIILSNSTPPAATSHHKALYLRKTDPMQDDSDATIMVGSPHLSLDQGIYFSPFWTPELTLTPENRALFDKPLSLTNSGIKPSLMSYWGMPVAIVENSGKAITYTMPLVDKKGVVRGVLGVGMVESYFDTLLPSHELAADGLGYLLTMKHGDDLFPLIHGRPKLQNLFPIGKPIQLIPQDLEQNIFRIVPEQASPENNGIAACILPLHTYSTQTPFAADSWQLIGLVNEDSLYAFPAQIRKILMLSLVASLLMGGALAVLFSRHVTTPIVNLAHSVENTRSGLLTTFPRTGMTEIDRLTMAMENANRNMANSTARMLRIVDMANVPMGAFELKHNLSQVFATERLRHLLLLTEDQATALYSDERAFMNHLRAIMAKPEPEEEAVYKISDDPERWVKIHLASENNDVLGLVSDVTEDMQKKHRIRHERDYDALTGLCSRTFFRRQVSTLMDLSYMLDLAAMIMLDLDKFKAINDTYGHQCGDDYLNALANHMSTFAGLHSIVGRRSGDEFFVFAFRLEGRESLRATVRHFYARLNATPFIFPDGSSHPIGVSIGIAWFNGNTDYEDLLRTADSALYQAKAAAPGTMLEYS